MQFNANARPKSDQKRQPMGLRALYLWRMPDETDFLIEIHVVASREKTNSSFSLQPKNNQHRFDFGLNIQFTCNTFE